MLHRSATSLGLTEILHCADNSVVTLNMHGREGRWMVRRSKFYQEGMPHTLLLLSDVSGVLREQDEAADSPGAGEAAAAKSPSPQPGVLEIDALVEQVRTAGLPVSYRVSPDARSLPEGIQLTAYRIVQEALTNALKHAGPSATAAVELIASEAGVRISVSDTGTATPAPNGNGGSGLRGMRERAAIYDGVVEAGPRPQGGWLVEAQLPR